MFNTACFLGAEAEVADVGMEGEDSDCDSPEPGLKDPANDVDSASTSTGKPKSASISRLNSSTWDASFCGNDDAVNCRLWGAGGREFTTHRDRTRRHRSRFNTWGNCMVEKLCSAAAALHATIAPAFATLPAAALRRMRARCARAAFGR